MWGMALWRTYERYMADRGPEIEIFERSGFLIYGDCKLTTRGCRADVLLLRER
jgi:hypothetical protein